MYQALRNFTPTPPTVSIAGTTSSARSVLTNSPVKSKDVLLYNSGTTLAFFRFGDSSVVATTTDTPLPPGTLPIFFAGDNTHVAVIMASGTATIYATSGFGN